jgi:hypothetical protein
LLPHLNRSRVAEECFFFTWNGYFGRAPIGEVKKDYVIAVIGGEYVPYVLEKHQSHYVLVSHAYVEGVMDLKVLPNDIEVQRIELG